MNGDQLIKQGVQKNLYGDYEGAIAVLNEAIQLNSNLAEAYYHRGYSCLELAGFDQAIAEYQQVIKILKNSAELPENINSYIVKAFHNRGFSCFSTRR